MASIFVIFSKDCSFLVLLASLLFHRCEKKIGTHDDCKFHDEWLVQDKYKDSGGERWRSEISAMPVLHEIFQVPSSMIPWTMPMAMHDCKQCQLPNEFSALGQLGYLRKSESMSGHVPVLFMCCEYHFLDGTINSE